MATEGTPARGDRGYALVAAVTAVAAFAYVAFQVLATSQGGVAIVSGRMEQARLSAAADAGIALALYGLGADDRGSRWSIDGKPRDEAFGDMNLTIVVEDERGKAPLTGLTDEQARALFAGAGVEGARLDALVTEFRDWQTEDNSPPPAGSILAPPTGPLVRHGAIRTVGELAGLADMDPVTLARIAPAVTLFFEETGPFEAKHASPLAIAAMRADTSETPDQIASEAQTANETPDEELAPDDHLVGHTLTIRVTARDRQGGHTQRAEIVEFSGDPGHPVWVRYMD